MAIILRVGRASGRTGIIDLRGPRVSIDEQHIALPKLYGAPAYARPAAPVAESLRPFDPDDLPIEAFMTDEEREIASTLPAHVWAGGGTPLDRSELNGKGKRDPSLNPRPFTLKGIAGKLLGGD